MEVVGLWRYPVKSLQGERIDVASVVEDGIEGDRHWGIRDEGTGRILTARRRPELLRATASYDDEDLPVITLPGGAVLVGPGAETDRGLSEWLGSPVSLVSAEGWAGRAEFFEDATDDRSRAVEWTMPEGRFVDAAPVLVLTTSSLRTGTALYPDGTWEARRFRPNVLLEVVGEGWVEDGWIGQTLRLGSAELAPAEPCVRCTMVTRSQPGLDPDVDIFRTLARHHRGHFGVWSVVAATGVVSIGDLAILAPAAPVLP